MPVELHASDLQRLIAIVKGLPQFVVERDRYPFLVSALGESPRAKTVAGNIDFGGAAESAASKTIIVLAGFGQLEYDKSALGVFLNAVTPYVDLHVGDEIAALHKKYALDLPVASRRPIAHWKATDTGQTTTHHEKVIGENTLFPIAVLQRALAASRAVVLVRFEPTDHRPSQIATGFLVAPSLIMTNHHVVGTAADASDTTYTFNYQLDLSGKECPTTAVQSKKKGLFWADKALDAAVIEVEGVDPEIQPLKLSARVPGRDDAVTIVGHPAGHLKQISLRNNAIQYVDEKVIQYTASTEPGSSGSPLLDRAALEVIGLHHTGGELVEPGSGARYLRNAGTTMRAILLALKTQAAKIYSRLSM
jgi:V8-like Glu-specific endopeptidase